ncbi:tRNA (guanosine(37)-N1)-methyltransferase TrmD [Candidatus Dojkabacteria bacterium]|nr:tRNA (guanosine(37)-N1)-methyltransferase TrmD [Candidatus Dojkabacteria bacterium]
MIRFHVVTIFPDQIKSFLEEGIFRIAVESGHAQIKTYDLRKWGIGKHKKVDDRPFGGGPGMVLMCEPIFNAVNSIKESYPEAKVVMLSPQGQVLSQNLLQKFADEAEFDTDYILLCGHYEGFDERIRENIVDIEISIGKYVLSGGELPALVLMDGIIRLIPGVLGNEDSASAESFQKGDDLDYPQYTRPENYTGMEVPDVLLSGNHQKIDAWRKNNTRRS